MNQAAPTISPRASASIHLAAELPLVTIITPSYNRGDLLEETIQSVLNQDYPNIEYVIIDDGSTDNTELVLRKYEQRAQVIRKENTGENATVNLGFHLAKGKYVCVVNSDDPILKHCISSLVSEMEMSPQATIAYGDWAMIGPNHEFLKYERLRLYTTENMLANVNFGMGPGILIRQSAIVRHGARREAYRYAGDMEFMLRMSLHGGFVYVPQVLATHRLHPDSLSVKSKRDAIGAEMRDAFRRTMNSPAFPTALRARRPEFLTAIYRQGRVSYATTLFDRLRLGLAEQFWHYWRFDLDRLAFRVARKLSHTFADVIAATLRMVTRRGRASPLMPPAQFAFSTRFLPPLWSGQAVVIRRLLTGVNTELYRLIGHPVVPLKDVSGDYIGALNAHRYELPPVRQLGSPRQEMLVLRTVNLLWGIWQRTWHIVAAMKNDRPEILVACTGDQMDPPATWLAAKILGSKYCLYFFDEYGEQWWADRTIFPVIKLIESYLVPRSDLLIAPNHFMARKLMVSYGKHCDVVHNPMPTTALPPAVTAFPADGKTVKLVFTGAVYHLNYAVFQAITVAISTMIDINAELHIYTAQSHEQIANEGVEGVKVKLHRHLRPDEVVKAQCEADVLLVPFNDAPDCLELVRTSATAKLADYLATGRPLLAICPDDAFLAAYLNDNECGLSISSLHPAAIQAAIRKIAFDAELRAKLREKSRECVQRDFDPKIESRKLLNILGG